jgi:hypothetical protein
MTSLGASRGAFSLAYLCYLSRNEYRYQGTDDNSTQ